MVYFKMVGYLLWVTLQKTLDCWSGAGFDWGADRTALWSATCAVNAENIAGNSENQGTVFRWLGTYME